MSSVLRLRLPAVREQVQVSPLAAGLSGRVACLGLRLRLGLGLGLGLGVSLAVAMGSVCLALVQRHV